jgi:putative oxidoreductase
LRLFRTIEPSASSGWILLRLTLAGLIAAHGWARLLAGGVEPFGAWLVTQGIPLGPAVAWAITLLEIVATPVFAAGWLVFPLSLAFAAIYTVGIAMVHAKAGWFVVGLGRNGAEYSVLLVVTLLCVGAQHRGRSRG